MTDPDQIKLIQTQDKRYVEYRRVMESRKAERLRNNLHLIQDGQRAKHTFFVDSKKEGNDFFMLCIAVFVLSDFFAESLLITEANDDVL